MTAARLVSVVATVLVGLILLAALAALVGRWLRHRAPLAGLTAFRPGHYSPAQIVGHVLSVEHDDHGIIVSGVISPGMAAAFAGQGVPLYTRDDEDTDAEIDEARALLLVHYLAMRDELDAISADDDVPERTRTIARHLAQRADALLT